MPNNIRRRSSTSSTAPRYPVPGDHLRIFDIPGSFTSDMASDNAQPTSATSSRPPLHEQQPKIKQEYLPRQCRICLEVVLPTFGPVSDDVTSRFRPAPKVYYTSEDPESGRLIRPCKCRGSKKYVHEGCLQSWRFADTTGRKNLWECPTCRFKYRLDRLRYAAIISNPLTEIILTIAVMLCTVFFFGFIADPIIDLYLDPLTTITNLPSIGRSRQILEDEYTTWTEHWLKGLASLGLMGFLKVLFAMPWWNIRGGGGMGGIGRGRVVGRHRLESISWAIVLTGVVTFLYVIWKWIRSWCQRTLERVGERVMDVQEHDAMDDE